MDDVPYILSDAELDMVAAGAAIDAYYEDQPVNGYEESEDQPER
jgi:hypothetical protein